MNEASNKRGSAATDKSRLAMVPAGRWRRVGSLVYELFPLAAIAFFGAASALLVRGGEPVAPGDVVFRIYLLALWYGYFVLSWWRAGQTLGMRPWRLHVRDVSGARLSAGQANKRLWFAVLGLIPLAAGHLLALGPQQRSWHDRMAGTQIFHAPK